MQRDLNDKLTTIALWKTTRARLAQLRITRRESYDEVINRLLKTRVE